MTQQRAADWNSVEQGAWSRKPRKKETMSDKEARVGEIINEWLRQNNTSSISGTLCPTSGTCYSLSVSHTHSINKEEEGKIRKQFQKEFNSDLS